LKLTSLGQYLAVGWSDGIVEVVSAETGNVLQHFKQPSLSGKSKAGPDVTEGVTCVGWGLNFIDTDSVKKKIAVNGITGLTTPADAFDGRTSDDWNERHDSASLDDFLERVPDGGRVEIPLDLPEQLARLDISTSMVRLPALPLLPPAAYKEGDHPAAELFSSQISLDAALYSSTSRSINALEALLLAHDSGQVRLVLYDALSIGEVSLPVDWGIPNVKFRQCASHPFSSTYMFLVDIPSKSGHTNTALVPLSLRFLPSSGSQLHLIESKTAHLEILIQYVGECLLALNHHWKHAKELPSKFMGNANEELAEQNEPNLVQSLYHLAATGDCPPTLKEWLVNILAERVSGYPFFSITQAYTVRATSDGIMPSRMATPRS
jgi:anaphase-promoting complex subunit 4